MEKIVKTQAELDAIGVDEKVTIKIEGGTYYDRIIVKNKYYWSVEARGNSSVEARDNSSVEAWENSSVVARGNSSVEARDNSSVEARENSSVVAWENSSVEARGNSSVEARDNSSVEARENSSVEAWENSSVVARGNSVIKRVYDKATIVLYGFACIAFLYGAKSVTANGFNVITQIGTAAIKIIKSANTIFNQFKETFETNPDFDFYKLMYPVKQKGDVVTLFKTVHKSDKGTYFSQYDKNFTYVIGETKTEKVDVSKSNSCSAGIHVSHKAWALEFARGWEDTALLECEVDVNDIIVSTDCDGKVRTSKIKVVREVPKKEWKT